MPDFVHYDLSFRLAAADDVARTTLAPDWDYYAPLQRVSVRDRSADQLIAGLDRMAADGVRAARRGHRLIPRADHWQAGAVWGPRSFAPRWRDVTQVPPDTAWRQVGDVHIVHPRLARIGRTLFAADPRPLPEAFEGFEAMVPRGPEVALDKTSFTLGFSTYGNVPLLTSPAVAPAASLSTTPAVVSLHPDHPARGLLMDPRTAHGFIAWLEAHLDEVVLMGPTWVATAEHPVGHDTARVFTALGRLIA